MDKKLFMKTFKYICSECGEFSDSLREYCEKCGAKESIRIATKNDYKKHEKKAQTKARSELGNIEDYLKILEQYESGNYEYGTVKSEKDINDAYIKGKSMVFMRKHFGQFFVLDPKGLAFKKKVGEPKLYSWKELIVKSYEVKSTTKFLHGLLKVELPGSIEVHITLPDGSLLKFYPFDYDLKEFPSVDFFVEDLNKKLNLEQKYINELRLECKKYRYMLMARTFDRYYYLGKYERNS